MERESKEVNRLLKQVDVLTGNRDHLERELLRCDYEHRIALQDYRIESTSRVLQFILSEYRDGKLPDLETLLVHCLNKLRGNIDGVELSLRDLQSKEIAVLPLTTATSSGQEEKCYGQHDR